MSRKLTLLLMYLGVIPFVGSAFLLMSNSPTELMGVAVQEIAASYTLLIGSFMAGVHWGQHLENSPLSPSFLAIFSNSVTLAFWFSFLFMSFSGFMIAAALLFVAILSLDALLLRLDSLETSYGYSRIAVTGLVAVSLLSMGML